MSEDKQKITAAVRQHYSSAAQSGSCCSSASCGNATSPIRRLTEVGYSQQELESVPAGTVMGLGCGNPTALAELRAGETVLDLGSGGGLDAFLAAQRVGPGGSVIGVDMTAEMVARATQAARRGGHANVEFRQGEIEQLPVADGTVDVIISNCVLNLTLDKVAAFQEAFRVLRPGGRMLISDLVTQGELPAHVRSDLTAWAQCIGGALQKDEYLGAVRRAGFRDVTIVSEHVYDLEALAGKIISVQVRAVKGDECRMAGHATRVSASEHSA